MNLRTVPATIALGVSALLLLLGLAWLFVLGPKLDGLSQAREERIALEDRNTTMRIQYASLVRLADDLPEARTRADDLAGVFPPTADQPGFFSQVTAAAVKAGVKPADVTTLSPGVPVLDVPEAPPAPPASDDGTPAPVPVAAAPTLARQAITIDVTGSYKQLTSLLEGLEKTDRGLLAASVALASADGGLTLTLTGTTFVAPPLGDPPSGTP